MARALTEKDVSKLVGGRKLNPSLIDPALDVLRGLYLGFAYPHSFLPKIRENSLFPIKDLLLDPDMAEKISDEIGPINLPVLQKMVEDAAVVANRGVDVANQISEFQNRLNSVAYPPYAGIPKVRIPKIPKAFSGKFIDGATQLVFMDAIQEKERKMEKDERIRLIGADIDPDNYFEMIKHVTRISGESQWLAEKISPTELSAKTLGNVGSLATPGRVMKGLTYAGLVKSEEFKAFQAELNKSIDADMEELKGMDTFKKYVEAWPVAGDSIMAAFVGVPVTMAYLPLREIATIGLVASRDPAVRQIAMGIASNTDNDDGAWHNLFGEINRSVTDSVKSGGFKDMRIVPEIATQFALTSPVTWDALGMRNPSINYVAEGLQSVQWLKENVRQRMDRGVTKKVLDFFTDKDILGFEEMSKKVNDYLGAVLGPKYGKEMIGKLKGDINSQLENSYMNMKARGDQALALREKMLGITRNRFSALTPDEQQAAILKLQTNKPLAEGGVFNGFSRATDSVKKVWNSEIVDDAVSYIRGRMDFVRKFDPALLPDPYYFPAGNMFAKDGAHLAEAYAARGYMKERTATEVVIPTLDTLNQDILNFADRQAAPLFVSKIADKTKSARAVATATIDIVAGAIKEPEKYIDDIAGMFSGVAYPNRGKKVSAQVFNQAWSEFQNTVFLTSRAGDWIGRNILDDMVRGGMNMYDNFKAGKIPTAAGLREAFQKQMPSELYDGMFSRALMDDADPVVMGQASLLKNGYNDAVYGIAEGAQRKALNVTASFNYAAEKQRYMELNGLTQLTPEQDKMILAKSVETSKEYMLANQVNSAFSSNLATKLLISYPGFFMRANRFMINELGRSPEIFTAGAALANQLREVNEDQPEWNKHRVIAFGRSFGQIQSMSMWPIVRAVEYFDHNIVKTDPESKLQRDADILRGLPPDEQKNILANDKSRGLLQLVSRSGLRAVGSYVETFRDMNITPVGVGLDAALKMTGVIQKRAPYWMIGSQQLNQFGRAIGWDSLGVEGKLNPTVRAWEQNSFDIGAMNQMVQMFGQEDVHRLFMKRSEKDKPLSQADLAIKKEMIQKSTDAYRNTQMKDLIFNRYFGFGKKFDKNIQEFNNVVARYSFAEDFITPDPQDIADIKETSGLKNDDEAEFLWKTSQLFAASRDRKTDPYRKKLLREFPAIPEMKALLSQRASLKTYLGMRDAETMLTSFPEQLQGDAKKANRVYNAFLKLNEGSHIIEEGKDVYKFNDGRKVGEILAQWTFSPKADQRLKLLEDPNVEKVVKQLDPDNYAHIKLMRNRNWVAPAETTFEEQDRGAKSSKMGELFKRAILNPSGAPMDIFDAYLDGKPETVEKMNKAIEGLGDKAYEAITEAGEFLMRPFVSNAQGEEEFQPSLGRELEMAADPGSEEGREAMEQVFKFMKDFEKTPAMTKAVPTTEDEKKATEFFRSTILDGDPAVRAMFKKTFPKVWKQRAYEYDEDGHQIIGRVVGASDSPDVIDYMNRLNRSLADPYSNQQTYQDLVNQGKRLLYGKPIIERMKNNGEMRALIETVEYQADGNIYRMGVQRNPNFNLNREEDRAAFDIYKRTSFSPPDETHEQYRGRLYKEVRELPQEAHDRYSLFLRRQGYTEMPELISEIRAGSDRPIPLDRNTRRRIDDFRDLMPYIEDDPFALKAQLAKDHDLTATILRHEPRLYKTLQSKLFAPYDKGWSSYLASSQYAPEAINYMRRLAPQTYARLYWKDPNFSARMDQYGYPQPAPTAETSVTRSWTDANGVVRTQTLPDVLAPPEPISPDPVPRGTFSSLPASLNYVAQSARDEVYRLNTYRETLALSGQSLPKADAAFLRMSPTERIFSRFPAVIAQGFREGQLGPEDVISNLKGVSDFGLSVGAIAPESYEKFNSFLGNATNTLGATRFGFQLGSFLDEAFNIPRVPVSNAYVDFILAGRPVSTVPRSISTTEATSLAEMGTVRNAYRASLPSFSSIEPAPAMTSEGANYTQEVVAQGTGAGAAAAGVAGAAAPAGTAAASGLPVVGVVLGAISAGFTIANILKSSRARKRAKGESFRAQQERQRQLDTARAQAEATQAEASNRAVASERFQILQKEEQLRERDFNQRLQQVLAEGVSFASLGQQPREFINTFVDRFEPQLVEFTRRPQIDSRVNLIASIQSKLPKARY